MKKIIEFQKAHGLTADGVIGKKTLTKLKEVLKITSDEALAHFLGQVSCETGDFNLDTENLNYSEDRLLEIFGRYFTKETAKKYAKNPEKIGSIAYANRMGNGNADSKEGYIFRGRGSLQLTGKDNYKLFSKFIGEDCVANPELVATKYFFESAMFYFNTNKLWQYTTKVDDASILKVSRAINLGNANSKGTPHGMKVRTEKTKEFYALLKK